MSWETYKDIWAAGLILKRITTDGPRYLLLQSSKHGEWGFPKGHIDPGEALWPAAVRECAEESGIGLFASSGEPVHISYQLPKGLKHVVYWPAITNQERIQLSDEHRKGCWLSHEDVLDRLNHENLKDVFRQLA